MPALIPLTCRHGQTRKYCTTPYLSTTQVDLRPPHVFREYYLKLYSEKQNEDRTLCFETIKPTDSLSLAFVARTATETQPCSFRLITTFARDLISKSLYETCSRAVKNNERQDGRFHRGRKGKFQMFSTLSSTKPSQVLFHDIHINNSIPN